MENHSKFSPSKLVCWIIFAAAIYIYQTGATVASLILAALAILMFFLDFKAFKPEYDSESAASNPGKYFTKKIKILGLVACILVASQIVMDELHKQSANQPAPLLCFICAR